MYGNGARVIRR